MTKADHFLQHQTDIVFFYSLSKATALACAAIARNDWERDAMGREALDFDAVCYFESNQRSILFLIF